jgi:hypothetical protein
MKSIIVALALMAAAPAWATNMSMGKPTPNVEAPEPLVKLCAAGIEPKKLYQDPQLWKIFTDCIAFMRSRFDESSP